MANHKSAKKRAKQTLVRTARNRATKSQVKTAIIKLRSAAASNPAEAATELKAATSAIDKAAKKGVMHAKTAARKISRLSKLVNGVSA